MSLRMFLLLLLLVFTGNASAQAPEAPDFLSDIKLGARLHGSFSHVGHTMRPLEGENHEFLGRPVSPDLSYTLPTYGASVGLRFRGLELMGTYRTSLGLTSQAWLRWQGGEQLLPVKPRLEGMSVHLQYFVTDQIGVGLLYQDQESALNHNAISTTIDGATTSQTLFRYSRTYEALSFYVPLRYTLSEQLKLDAQVGVSLLAQAQDGYDMRFLMLKKDGPYLMIDPAYEGPTGFNDNEADLSLQFGEVSLTYEGLGVPVRLGLQVQRTSVDNLSGILQAGATLRLGLPF